jgi:Signal transduction histidine kinase
MKLAESDGNLTIIYEDNGRGVPDAEKEEIFMRGYGKNTGYGLFLIREIVSITGCTITEQGIPGEGARFLIEVSKGGFRKTNVTE